MPKTRMRKASALVIFMTFSLSRIFLPTTVLHPLVFLDERCQGLRLLNRHNRDRERIQFHHLSLDVGYAWRIASGDLVYRLYLCAALHLWKPNANGPIALVDQ